MMRAAWASFSDAWSSPSALMTLARRSRSASEWRAIARFISGRRATSFKRAEDWGVEGSAGEVKDVDLPPEMKRAIASQAEAERERRAKVINAEGERHA